MPPKKTKNSTSKMQQQIKNLQRSIGAREVRPPAKTVSKIVYKQSPNKSEGELAGKVMKMMLDPCHAEPVSFPDEYSGRTVLIRSATRSSFLLDASGNRGVAVSNLSKSKIAFSGSATYGTWIYFDDNLQSELASSNYQYIRQVAMCATIKPVLPSTSTAPEIRSWCGPHLSTSARGAAGTNFDDKPSTAYQTRADAEAAWCAREAKNFVPFSATTAPGSGTTCIDGSLTINVPNIHFDCRGGSPSAEMQLEVVAVYECFYSEQSQFKPGAESPMNYTVCSLVMNAIKKVNWTRSGDAIGKVSAYANQVYKFMQKPAVQAAWSVGKTIAMAGVSLL